MGDAVYLKEATVPRNIGTDRNGNNFDENTKQKVWRKGHEIPGKNPDEIRKDECGAFIEYHKYGEYAKHGNGWEIDHIKPVAKGGGDDLDNLQPLQWENNRSKGDDYPKYDCVTFAES